MDSNNRKVDSTAFLRQKLGFTDDAEWKRFSNRRLELINLLKLEERKASKQEPQIHKVAETVASEFGYDEEFIPDFERLVRLGIQSVRRNRRRPTKSGSLNTTTFELDPQPSSSAMGTPLALGPATIPSVIAPPLQVLVDLCRGDQPSSNPLVSAGAVRLAMGLAMQPDQIPKTQLLLQALESGPMGEELARITSCQSVEHLATKACARDHAVCVNVLRALFAEMLAQPDLSAMLQHLKNLELALVPAWPPQQQLQQQQAQQLQPAGPQPSGLPQQSPPGVGQQQPQEPQQLAGPSSHPSLPPLEGPMWADRLVTIFYGERQLKFTFSPLKGSPPTVSEIIESCRASFGLRSTDVLRVRTRDSGKIIDTNADLADAFLSNKLDLEVFLPPDPASGSVLRNTP